MLGDQEAQHRNEGLLATAYLDAGDIVPALEILQRHLKDARATVNEENEMQALGNLGNAYHQLYEVAKAEEYYRQVLEIAQRIGDERFKAQALGALGEAHDSRGEHRQATHMFRQRLALARQTEDLRSEARALRELGSSSRRAGHPFRACVLLRCSLQIFEDLGDRNEQGNVLNALGIALAELTDATGAKDCFARALVLAREEEAPRLEADVVGNLAKVAMNLEGDLERALELFKEQFEIAEGAGDKTNQANASLDIATIHSMEDRLHEAISYGRRASRLYEETGNARVGEATECVQHWEAQRSS